MIGIVERLKEKFRMTVYKAVIVQKLGESEVVYETEEQVTKKTKNKKIIEIIEKTIKMNRYRVVGVKFVDPNKGFFKYKVNKIKKELPCDFAFEAYNHNEKHVMFIDFDSGHALKIGGGLVEYARPPQEEATKTSLMKSVGDLMASTRDTQMLILALGLGIFLGVFIANTLLPMLGA